jgi:hypothetical protein
LHWRLIVRTAELTDAALDWAVAKALGRTDVRVDDDGELVGQEDFDYSTDWNLAGPLIERERTNLYEIAGVWKADIPGIQLSVSGPTPLIAAMRCLVISKLGYEVQLPEGV